MIRRHLSPRGGCSSWRRCVNTPEEPALLQEIMGYLLVPDTSQQKIFSLFGVGRSGKGTIARVITALCG